LGCTQSLELGRNTTITNLAIVNSVLSREIVHNSQPSYAKNTALHLNPKGNRLRNAGLAEIASVLNHNTPIKTLDLSTNGLGDIRSANLRDLLRRNNDYKPLVVAVPLVAMLPLLEHFRRFAQQPQPLTGLIFADGLDDQGTSILADTLAIRNASMVKYISAGTKSPRWACVHLLTVVWRQ
jgi:hypothetical protein